MKALCAFQKGSKKLVQCGRLETTKLWSKVKINKSWNFFSKRLVSKTIVLQLQNSTQNNSQCMLENSFKSKTCHKGQA